MQLYNENCFSANLKVEDNSIDLFLCDPPFGIGESEFDRHYKRSSKTITNNYFELKYPSMLKIDSNFLMNFKDFKRIIKIKFKERRTKRSTIQDMRRNQL